MHPSNLNYGPGATISGLPGILTRTLPPLPPEIRLGGGPDGHGFGGGDLDVTADIKPKAERVSLNTSERGGGERAAGEGGRRRIVKFP